MSNEHPIKVQSVGGGLSVDGVILSEEQVAALANELQEWLAKKNNDGAFVVMHGSDIKARCTTLAAAVSNAETYAKVKVGAEFTVYRAVARVQAQMKVEIVNTRCK